MFRFALRFLKVGPYLLLCLATSLAHASASLSFFSDQISVNVPFGGTVCHNENSFNKSSLVFNQIWEEDGQTYELNTHAKFITTQAGCTSFIVAGLTRPGQWNAKLKSEDDQPLFFSIQVREQAVAQQLTLKTPRGQLALLKFSSWPINTQTSSVEFCSTALVPIFDAILWKTDAQHSAGFPLISNHSIACGTISGLDLFVPGDWSLDLQLENGQHSIFKFKVLP